MSKIARLASIVERAEKQALVLFIKESKQNDNTAVAMLKKRGVPEPEKVLELLKEITVDGTENGKTVWDISKTGKEIQPLAGWFCSTWNNDDLVQARERVADTVHKMYRIPSARNADLTKVWMANRDLTAFEAWLTKMYEKDKAKGNIVDTDDGEKVDLKAYKFPKKMLAYSDDMVDCYRADTPAEAMLLGKGYGFCISRRDGSNMFYSYRMNPTTTAYFCWFKDKQGNKTHDNMCVLHVGEDGKYMATPSQNGPAPRESAQNIIKKYPGLKGAIESDKLTVTPTDAMEKEVRQKYSYRSDIKVDDLEGKSPKYIELVLAQGVKLTDDAFDYIFNNIDNGNLRTGNNGNSLIKKYVESGIHKLSEHQNDVLIKAGYENEVARAIKVWWRGRLELHSDMVVIPKEDIMLLLKYGDLDSEDSVVSLYIEREGLVSADIIAIEELGKDYLHKLMLVDANGAIKYDTYGANGECILENGKVVYKGTGDDRLVFKGTRGLHVIDAIENVESFGAERVSDWWKIPELRGVEILRFYDCNHIDFSLFKGLSFTDIELSHCSVVADSLKEVSCKNILFENFHADVGHRTVTFPKGVRGIGFSGPLYSMLQLNTEKPFDWPEKLEYLELGDNTFFLNDFLLKGITEEVTKRMEVDISRGIENMNIVYFPKKVNELNLAMRRIDTLPDVVLNCDVKRLVLRASYSESTLDNRTHNLIIKDKKVLDWVMAHSKKVKLEDYVGEVRDEGSYYDVDWPDCSISIYQQPDKPIKTLKLLYDVPQPHRYDKGDLFLSRTLDLDDLPYEVTNVKEAQVYFSECWRSEFNLTHKVKGLSQVTFINNKNLTKVEGMENLEGLDHVNVEGCPKLDIEHLKAQLPEGVTLYIGDNKYESLSLSPLSMALNSIID